MEEVEEVDGAKEEEELVWPILILILGNAKSFL